MNNYKYKFDKLSELIDEIDTVIADLTSKKKEILSKIDDDMIRLARPESRGKYITKDGKAYKLLEVQQEDENKTTSFTTFVNTYTYDLLNKIVNRHKEKVSTFLKNRYFYNFITDTNYANQYAKDYIAIKNELGDKLSIKDAKDRNSMAIALKSSDTRRLKKAAETLDISPRDIIKHLINLVVYDELINKKIKEPYEPEDKNITYVKCNSSNVKAYGYDVKTRTLYIEFVSGGKYKYSDVPEQLFQDMVAAGSKGDFVNNVLKTSNIKFAKIN